MTPLRDIYIIDLFTPILLCLTPLSLCVTPLPLCFTRIPLSFTSVSLCFTSLTFKRATDFIGQCLSEYVTWMSGHWLTRVAELRFETWERDNTGEFLSRWNYEMRCGCGIFLLVIGWCYVASTTRFSPIHDRRGVTIERHGARQCNIAFWLGVAIHLLPILCRGMASGWSFWNSTNKSASMILI